jgi:hypothetical protein
MKYALPLSLVCLVIALTAALFGFTDLDPRPLVKFVLFVSIVAFVLLVTLGNKGK